MVDDIEWNGYMFPRVIDNDGAHTDQPEAYPTRNATLPHNHHDLNTRFPTATACPALPKEEAVDDRVLEEEAKSPKDAAMEHFPVRGCAVPAR